YNYDINNTISTLLLGTRYYKGSTNRIQGFGNKRDGPDFSFLHTDDLENSVYDFPSRNFSFFGENVFRIDQNLSITPGFRFEHIKTASKGYYTSISRDLAGNILQREKFNTERVRKRQFMLFGLAASYDINTDIESYANFSTNYRGIGFNDIRVVNTNLEVDPGIKDEKGFSSDLGLRGKIKDFLHFDGSIFYLKYNDRIGAIQRVDSTLFKPIRYRTNISDSRHIGLETYFEVEILRLLNFESSSKLNLYSNLTLMNAKYINSKESSIEGNFVELAPSRIWRSGIEYNYKDFIISLKYSYTSKQYTDATNAEITSTAVNGKIPSYQVLDLNTEYSFKRFTIKAGINNLTDNKYFTRRADGYPGPGIIPSPPRNYYITLKVMIE
ncbi:MAG: TonB-dependent receptor domain-containing protein, partial [Flavobacteriales bacterium]